MNINNLFFSSSGFSFELFISILTLIVAIFGIWLAYNVYKQEKEEREGDRKNEQIKLLGGLLAELDIISAPYSTLFGIGGYTKGNLQWYKEELEASLDIAKALIELEDYCKLNNIKSVEYQTLLNKLNNVKRLSQYRELLEILVINKKAKRTIKELESVFLKTITRIINGLDHNINKISFDKYITSFSKSICTNIDLNKLFRTLSFINDKIEEINTHTINVKAGKENLNQLSNILDIIDESIERCEKLREVLDIQITNLEK